MTPAQAWQYGTNVQTAYKYCKKETFVALTAMLKSTLDYLDYNKTIRETEHIIEAVEYLIEWFPAMKLEEWRCIMMNFKTGKYGNQFERLMLPEIVEAFKQFEGERAERMEKQIQRNKDIEQPEFSEEQRDIFKRLIKDLNLPEDDTDDKGRWKFIQYPSYDGSTDDTMAEQPEE